MEHSTPENAKLSTPDLLQHYVHDFRMTSLCWHAIQTTTEISISLHPTTMRWFTLHALYKVILQQRLPNYSCLFVGKARQVSTPNFENWRCILDTANTIVKKLSGASVWSSQPVFLRGRSLFEQRLARSYYIIIFIFIIICKLFVGRELFIGGAVLKSTNHYNSSLLFNWWRI